MMKTSSTKRYSSPELILKLFVAEDVITASSNDNLGAIPEGWYDVDAQGGNN